MGNRFYDGQPGPEIRRSLNELEAVFDDAILNAKGPQGWAPVLAGAIDGARRVHQVVDWTGGEGDKPTALGYIGAAGIVADIADAVDVRGPQGAAGADGADGTNGADGAQGPDGPQGQSGADGSDGADGNDGWTAVLANVADGARIVQQVVDWVGGQGAKPTTGKYVGPTGLVDTAAEAVNVRGPAGSGSGDVTGPASSTDGHVALFDGATGKALKGGGALGTAAAQNVEYFASAAEGALALTSLQPDDVAAVATSGAYADLSGRPTIPAAQQQTDWNAPSGVTAIANKPAVIAAGATQAAARTAIGAGTSNLADAPSDGKTYGRKDAGWVEASSNTMSGATASAAGSGGSVPGPPAGAQNKFLRGDGTWAAPTAGVWVGEMFLDTPGSANFTAPEDGTYRFTLFGGGGGGGGSGATMSGGTTSVAALASAVGGGAGGYTYSGSAAGGAPGTGGSGNTSKSPGGAGGLSSGGSGSSNVGGGGGGAGGTSGAGGTGATGVASGAPGGARGEGALSGGGGTGSRTTAPAAPGTIGGVYGAGGGGGTGGGGGGGGECVVSTHVLTNGQTLACIVGAGGTSSSGGAGARGAISIERLT